MTNQFEAGLQWLIDLLPLGVLFHDRTGDIIGCNPAAIQLLGRTREQLLGRTFKDLGLGIVDESGQPLSPDAYPAVHVLHTGHPVCGIVIGITRADDVTWLRIDAIPRLDAHGGVSEIICFLTDIGERREDDSRRKLVEVERRLGAQRLAAGPLGELFPGQGPVTRELRERIAEAARIRKLPVLILGERGTGKALVARAVHDLSQRAEGPFTSIDCAAIPAALFESELFGHRKGAFTGAIADKPGLFQQADRGTLFLDEIAELPLDLQPKLLMAIQERKVRQIGGIKEIPIDVRIMAATNRDLSQMRADGRFRHDLYDRLNGVQILVPTLRARRDDIEAYIDNFVMTWAIEEDKPLPYVDHAVRGALERYPWPGNVRELEMTIGRMVARAQIDRITMDLVPREIAEWNPFAAPQAAAHDRPEAAARREPTRAAIARMLKRHQYNKTRAAAALGISRDSLKRRVKRDAIPDKPDLTGKR